MRTHCPVCKSPLSKTWHIVCPACWAKVSKPLQDRVYDLWRRKRGSAEHRSLCSSIILQLVRDRRAAKAAS